LTQYIYIHVFETLVVSVVFYKICTLVEGVWGVEIVFALFGLVIFPLFGVFGRRIVSKCRIVEKIFELFLLVSEEILVGLVLK